MRHGVYGPTPDIINEHDKENRVNKQDKLDQLSEIRTFIENERARRGITNVDYASKLELSEHAYGVDGEFRSLIERQLLTTAYGHGSWSELDDDAVRHRVIDLIRSTQHG